jgi:hypothetical protein
MEDAALNRLEAVVDVGNCAVEDDVASVFEKPVPVTLCKRCGVGGGVRRRRIRSLVFNCRRGLVG